MHKSDVSKRTPIQKNDLYFLKFIIFVETDFHGNHIALDGIHGTLGNISKCYSSFH